MTRLETEGLILRPQVENNPSGSRMKGALIKKRFKELLVIVGAVACCLVLLSCAQGSKLVALTFDDGPSAYTEELLDQLGERDVKATFFMTGKNGDGGTCGIENGYEHLLPRMWEEGHQLANHTYSHDEVNKLSQDEVEAEIEGVENLLFEAAGAPYECMTRIPGGHINDVISEELSFPMISWSLDTQDWKYRNAEHVREAIVKNVRPGDIVLMHDIYESSVEGAIAAIDELKEQGYEFVTVAELLRRTNCTPEGKRQVMRAGRTDDASGAYEAPRVSISDEEENGLARVSLSADEGLMLYYTTDGTYPDLSSEPYTSPVRVEAGTRLRAIGIDRYATRTPEVDLTL